MGYASVVVGTDGSASAEHAVRAAAELAGSAALVVVTAFDASGGDERTTSVPVARADAEQLAERGREVARSAGADRVEALASEGRPADVLLGVAGERGADLIVVGSLGMTGIARFTLGGVANDVTHHAPCDVLVVHTDDA